LEIEIFTQPGEIYDLIYQKKEYSSEIDFLARNILTGQFDNSWVLDVGCGTGLHAKGLREKGILTVGLDLNLEFIQTALNRSPSLNDSFFLVGDMRSIPFKRNKFGAIVMMFHVINFLDGEKELYLFLRNVHNLLQDGGKLIFDSWDAESMSNSDYQPKLNIYDNNDFKVIRKSEISLTHPDRVNVQHIFEVFNKITLGSEEFIENHIIFPLTRQRVRDCASTIFSKIEFKDLLNIELSEKNGLKSFYCVLHK
jgi:SAM-dependent methyltransferase